MGPTVSKSVVFTDLVGSTELSSRLGPERSEELRQVHFGLLRAAAAQNGGVEVKNLGDGLMVVFDSVGAALDGVVAMQQGLARHNRRARVPLQVRIGVSTGDVVEEDGDYFGEAVVEAARLCALAGGGQILATEKVRYFVSRSSGRRFEPVGELALKGLPDLVPAVRVGWASEEREAQVPLPPRLDAARSAERRFVGREDERRALTDALDAVQAGAQRVVFVAGEPGVGKTALIAEFASAVHRTGTVVLYGRCDEELAVPYQPWVEAMSHLVEHAPDALISAHVRASGSQLARLVPQLEGRMDAPVDRPSDAETERYLMFQSVCSLVESAAAEDPLLVVLDDLHWSDAPTLALLRHVVTAPMSTPPLIVATYRDTDVDRGHPLVDTLATLRRHAGFRRLALRGLDDAGVAALMESYWGRPLEDHDRDLVRSLRQETSGNPFFTREILRNLVERGDVHGGPEGTRIDGAALADPVRLPDSVLEVVRQRVDRLGPDVHRTLSAASVIGREFDLRLLSHVLGEPEDSVLDSLELAAAASVVEEVDGVADRYAFTHALGQHTMDADLSAARRRRLHRRVAEAMEALWPDDVGERVGELARHWLEATAPVDTERAIHYARLAGERALDALAPDEALRWFRSALEQLDDGPDPDPAQRCTLLVSLGTAQRQVGDARYRETLLEAAELAQKVGDTASLVAAALTNNRGYQSNSSATDVEKVSVLEAALRAVGDGDSVERALLLATLCAESNQTLDPPALEQLFAQALAMARRLGDELTVSRVVSTTRVAVHFLDTVEARVPLYEESRRIADDVADPVVCFHAAQALLWSGADRADMAVVDEQLDTMRSIAERTGQPTLQWMATYTEAMRAAIRGEHDESERLAFAAFEIGTGSGQPDAETFFGGQLARVAMMRGELANLADAIEEASQREPFPVFRALHAAARAQAGDLARARALLEAEMAAGFDGPHDMQWPTAMTQWVDAALRLEHTAAAAELYPLLVPFESLTGFTGISYDGPLGHFAGVLAVMLGDLDAAARHLERALALERGSGDVYGESLTRLALARLHQRRAGMSGGGDGPRDVQSAADHALRAHELARERRFGMVERDAAALLEDVGSR